MKKHNLTGLYLKDNRTELYKEILSYFKQAETSCNESGKKSISVIKRIFINLYKESELYFESQKIIDNDIYYGNDAPNSRTELIKLRGAYVICSNYRNNKKTLMRASTLEMLIEKHKDIAESIKKYMDFCEEFHAKHESKGDEYYLARIAEIEKDYYAE